MFGVSIFWRDLPAKLIRQHHLESHKIVRHDEADPEYTFHFRRHHPIPIVTDVGLLIVPWGSHRKGELPQTGWICQEDLQDKMWAHLDPVDVEIPCFAASAKGLWYHVPEGGIKAVMLSGKNQTAAYLITREATHYFQVMTRLEREPVFVGRQI